MSLPERVTLFRLAPDDVPSVLSQPWCPTAGSECATYVRADVLAAAQELLQQAEYALDLPEPPGQALQGAVERFKEAANG